MVGHAQDDTAAMTAVTAVRTAGRDIFFTVESNSAIAAAATGNGNSNFINKHKFSSLVQGIVGFILSETGTCIVYSSLSHYKIKKGLLQYLRLQQPFVIMRSIALNYCSA